MRNLAILGLAIGGGFVLLGYVARTPGQEALSNAVMAVGLAVIGFILVVSAIGLISGMRKR